jgi:Zn-dependent peptidase ImmA (M78 family)/DNA-binding XRE family transcriptional regulator
MNVKVNKEMVILGRESLGLTQKELAEATSLTQATISRYESGLIDVPAEQVAVLARVLKRPESFFYWSERLYGASGFYHRKLKSLSVRELHMIHARVNFLRMQAARLLRYAKIRSTYSFHRLNRAEYGGPKKCAQALRHLWQLPTGPIRNVVNSVEAAGGVVCRCSLGTQKADGISQWPLDDDKLPPVFFVRDSAPGDRMRWTLAHEIGHVVMHHAPTTDPEAEADEFAGEFLMPSAEIGPQLYNMTLPKAAELKGYWRTSMASIVRQAYQLGKISKERYTQLFKQIYAKMYHKCEPIPVPPEEPALFAQLARVQRTKFQRSDRELGEILGETEDSIRENYRHIFGSIRLAL